MEQVQEINNEHLKIVNEILKRGNDVCIEKRKNGIVIVEQKCTIHNCNMFLKGKTSK